MPTITGKKKEGATKAYQILGEPEPQHLEHATQRLIRLADAVVMVSEGEGVLWKAMVL